MTHTFDFGGFFTFLVALAHSVALPPQKYVHSSTNYTLTDTSSSLLRSGSSSLKTGKESGKCIFASCGWLGGHSKITWTNFDPILTTYPPRVDKFTLHTFCSRDKM